MVNIERMAESIQTNEGQPNVVVSQETTQPRSRGLIRRIFNRGSEQKVLELVKPGEAKIPNDSERLASITKELRAQEQGEMIPGVPISAQELASASSEVEHQPSWGGKNPLESFKGMLVTPEIELNLEGRGPAEIVDILLTISSMDAETRETHRPGFQEAADILKKYANDSKLLGFDSKVSNQQMALEKYDQATIDKVEQDKPGQGDRLQELLDELDRTELFLGNFNRDLADENIKGLSSEEEWSEFQSRQQSYVVSRVNLRQEINNIANDRNFLEDRDKQKAVINQAIEDLEIERIRDRDRQTIIRSAEPDNSEIILDNNLLRDQPPGDVARQLSSKEQLELFRKPSSGDAEKEGLSWYFHRARELKIVQDLDGRLDLKYAEWAGNLIPHQEMNPQDGSLRRVPGKSFDEVEDEIIEYFNTLLDPDRPQYVEQSARWNIFQRKGLTSVESERFQGIRAEFVRRAQAQVEDSLSNLELDLKRQNLMESLIQARITQAQYNQALADLGPDVRIDRISGEWNVHRLDRELRARRDREALEIAAEPLYKRESYYKVTLLGRDRQTIELGAEQAAENIMKSINNFDVQAIEIRTQALVEAIQEKLVLIRGTENVSLDEAQVIIDGIKDSITNKVDFYILEWAGQNLQMDFYANYLSNQMRARGESKLKKIPAMSDGLVGIAIHLLLNPEYRLYHRPQGWKGQMRDDDTTNKALRGIVQQKITGILMEYELKGSNEKERSIFRERLSRAHSWEEFRTNFQRKGLIPMAGGQSLTYEQYLSRSLAGKDYNVLPLEEYKRIEEWLTPVQRRDFRDAYYQQRLKEITAKGENATSEDLDMLRKAREARASEFNNYQKMLDRASSTVTVANQVMNIFGESAEIGDPSIVTKEGEFISLREATMFYKYAILQGGKGFTTIIRDGKNYRVNDNLALIRHRSKVWLNLAKRAGHGYDRLAAGSDVTVKFPDGTSHNFSLAKGFEETGITQKEWDRFKDAVASLNEKGSRAGIGGVKFEDIIKMEELKPLKNNFLADYISSMSQINSPEVRERVAKGYLPIVKNILVRLGFKDRQIVEGTTQQEIEKYTELIENSRSFDAEVERMAYYVATHPTIDRTDDGNYPAFNPDGLDFGFRGKNWGTMRLLNLRGFWYANLARTIPRGVDLVHMMPTLGKLAGEMDFENIEDLAWNINTSANGMESVDNPALVAYANRLKTMVYLRGRAEGSVAEGQGGLDKAWGWFEKWLLDANGLWKAIEKVGGISRDSLNKKLLRLNDTVSEYTPVGDDEAERYVDVVMSTLDRFKPMLTGNEKLLGEDRQALSAGSGYEDNERLIFRFSEWMISEKGGEGVNGREQGGSLVQKEIKDIIRLFMAPGTFTPGRVYREEKGKKVVDLAQSPSIWEEAMRKFTPSHNPRLPTQAPAPSYELLAD